MSLCISWRHVGEAGVYLCLLLTLAVTGGEWPALASLHQVPSTHPVGAWVGCTASLDILKKRKPCFSLHESNLDYPACGVTVMPTTDSGVLSDPVSFEQSSGQFYAFICSRERVWPYKCCHSPALPLCMLSSVSLMFHFNPNQLQMLGLCIAVCFGLLGIYIYIFDFVCVHVHVKEMCILNYSLCA